ncbi:hypothetical protein [Magnetospirillum sulfuroxidans]|uniref:Uncharacterized protein n=1 Tax=Magnetospirillum sulfuroxidans TaxID=611300 RepID=A0ABS5IAR0_9PROT|nr:hypothetical protein [Magnetospirillum sulfuroxidans]MBR9970838.1 hypothetical protein [Magnetospirillum sulfuroxidans]
MRRISARIKHGGLTFSEAVSVARRRVVDGEMYLISRHGGWFRPNAQGYCTTFAEAGIYDAETARSYLCVEGLSVVPVSSARDEINDEIAALERKIAANRR